MRPDALVRDREPPSTGYGGLGSGDGEGRIAGGLHVLGRCWEILRARPRLMVLPALSALATTLAALAVFLPARSWTHGLPDRVSLGIACAIAALPFTLIATTANVAFLALVEADRRGEPVRVRDGLALAWRRRGAIVGWSMLSVTVGAVLAALDELPVANWLGRLAGWLGGAAWGLATFFVVPVLALEGQGPIRSIRRSAGLFRARWGETLTGDLTLGVVTGFATMPGILVLCGGFGLGSVPMLVAGIVLTAPVIAVSATMNALFVWALFRETAHGELPAPFTPADMGSGLRFRRRPARWGRRARAGSPTDPR
jgi:hypothetical protein